MAITGMTTFLMFDDQALEAAEFYAALLPDTHITSTSYYEEDGQLAAGTPLVVELELLGHPLALLNAGPGAPSHSTAVSFQLHCETQADVDTTWEALIADGGSEGRCGWCTDRFGVSWQVIPRRLGELLGSSDPATREHAFRAMLGMGRIVAAGLERTTG